MKFMRLVVTGVRSIRREGLRSALARTRKRLSADILGQTVDMAVKTEDALAVDWTKRPERLTNPITVESGPVTIAWLMPPPSAMSGGHHNLFRFIDFAEKAGHRCIIYFYTNTPVIVNIEDMREMLEASPAYPNLAAEMAMYDSSAGVDPSAQAIFATSWETAYPVFRDSSSAKRFYFVQDYEPSFFPAGSEAMLAESTYRFGFHGITAGGWLSHKLHEEFGMATDHFDFAVDSDTYFVTNTTKRSEVFFYARPVTPRRGFELGLLGLEEFARRRPDVTINLAGWDITRWTVPFPHVNLSGLEISELNDIYNRCAAGLVISASNMSLLPLELIASGVAPVVNDAPNNRLVSDNPYIEYVQPAPAAIAERLIEVIDRVDSAERSTLMSKSVADVTWEVSGQQFVEAFERAMRG
jgi:glycosyltransferase involved in cell wall biosynthesis